MNLLLDNMLHVHQQANEALDKAVSKRRVIVIDYEADTAYGWVSYHPETFSIAQILFHDEPNPALDNEWPF